MYIITKCVNIFWDEVSYEEIPTRFPKCLYTTKRELKDHISWIIGDTWVKENLLSTEIKKIKNHLWEQRGYTVEADYELTLMVKNFQGIPTKETYLIKVTNLKKYHIN